MNGGGYPYGIKKAPELGIEIGIFHFLGWTQAGGPWVKSNEVMRYLATSELRIKGLANISTTLKKPTEQFGDLAVYRRKCACT